MLLRSNKTEATLLPSFPAIHSHLFSRSVISENQLSSTVSQPASKSALSLANSISFNQKCIQLDVALLLITNELFALTISIDYRVKMDIFIAWLYFVRY